MNLDEAQQTVRKKDGKYYDLSKDNLANEGKRSLNEEQFLNLFKKIRVRYSLTPKCNLFCNFCSNEGSNYSSKKMNHANIELIEWLSDTLIESTPISFIDFSGGEPTLHPDLRADKSKLIEWTKKYPEIRFSLHTNGTMLTPNLIDQLYDNFSRIGVSINATNFETWDKITNPHKNFSKKCQEAKYNKLNENLNYLSKKGINEKVFLKSVVMRGINDSEEELSSFLNLCKNYDFHPKFLQFEPQYLSQKNLEVPRAELFGKLEKLGCKIDEGFPREEKEDEYYPNVNFDYNNKKGLYSLFGCGKSGACSACYDYLCMFVKPSDDGKGLYLKPCSVLDTRFDLTHAIESNDKKQVLDILKLSREYLMHSPGKNRMHWNKEEEYGH